MKPEGETETALQTTARQLQSMGRNGDTILAHISPAEAMLLKKRGGAGTVHPGTGLLEFYDADKKEGSYIWRTQGDDKVRSAHAERDGKTFSWDDPPEGGHPGEAYNCRCRAEEPNCTIEWLEIREIEKELTPLAGRLGGVETEINNLKLAIEGGEFNINILKHLHSALQLAGNARAATHFLVRIGGIASDVAAVIVANKIREIKAEMQTNIAKLQPLEKERPILENKVRPLISRKELAKQTYNECMGI